MSENQNIVKKCEICNVDATTICFQCYSYFCESCSKLIHDKEYNQSHKKEKIDYFIPFDIKCPKHPKNILNLYCTEEKGKFNYL